MKGHYLEFGTFWGQSFFRAYHYLKGWIEGGFYAFDSFAGLVFGQWENVYFQRDHSAVDPEMWVAWDTSYREVAAAPSFRRVWEIEKHRYVPGFRNHVEQSP